LSASPWRKVQDMTQSDVGIFHETCESKMENHNFSWENNNFSWENHHCFCSVFSESNKITMCFVSGCLAELFFLGRKAPEIFTTSGYAAAGSGTVDPLTCGKNTMG
jgi:hypothetical protein